FQSRFGPAEWLRPYTADMVRTLARQGIKRIAVMAPGFAADCLETLEELALGVRKTFLEAGGEDFHYIPCLNASGPAIDLFATIARQELAGWI
ncbi:MAG: ferrochelatase, partial [Alphaproteobacteria bacterium]